MDDKCNGDNCNSIDGFGHSVECKFEHFVSYSGCEEDQSIEMIKNAFFDGYRAGLGEKDVIISEFYRKICGDDRHDSEINIHGFCGYCGAYQK